MTGAAEEAQLRREVKSQMAARKKAEKEREALRQDEEPPHCLPTPVNKDSQMGFALARARWVHALAEPYHFRNGWPRRFERGNIWLARHSWLDGGLLALKLAQNFAALAA